jgi:hypothetical protein
MKPLTIILIVLSLTISITLNRPASAQDSAPRRAQPPPVPASMPAQAEVQIADNKQLWELAHHLDANELLSQRLNRPQFFVKDGIFTYYQGDLPRMGDDESGPSQHPILVPLARALQLEDLRQLIAQEPDADMEFWTPYFDKAYMIIEHKMLPVIAAGGMSNEDLSTRLQRYDGDIATIFANTAPRAFAEAHQLQLRRGNIIIAVTHKMPVSFVLNPSGGRLWVIPSTFFTPDGKFDFMWREIDQNPSLGGGYYYKVKWPDSKITGPSSILIDHAGQIFTINE